VKNKRESPASDGTSAHPRFHQPVAEIQAYGTANHLLPHDGTNDLVVSRNELQAWFLSEHLVDAPLVHAEPVHAK
jgi:hypothetical protein